MDTKKIQQASDTAHTLYAGKTTPHRSCGICLAETFGLTTNPYQSLRRGGITGEGECGAIRAGTLILGEILGDPNPTAAVTDKLREGIKIYNKLWQARVDKKQVKGIICNELTGQFKEFQSDERLGFCTNIAATVAQCVAETLETLGVSYTVKKIQEKI